MASSSKKKSSRTKKIQKKNSNKTQDDSNIQRHKTITQKIQDFFNTSQMAHIQHPTLLLPDTYLEGANAGNAETKKGWP